MIDRNCIGPDVDLAKISPEADVSGASCLTGPGTSVSPGAVVRNSRLHDAAVDAGATVSDSILVAEGLPGRHNCDAAGRTVSGGADRPSVGRGARVSGCTLINVSVAERSSVCDTFARDCRIGEDNLIGQAKLALVTTGARVRVIGPTEVSEAWVGHGATIDTRGYFEGIFSNKFHKLRFDAASGKLEVADTIDLPHLSRYGVNTMNSTNSGKLLPQPGGVLATLGRVRGLWHDELLSHEQIELGPCCWVAAWTKVVGQSPWPHKDDQELVNDPLTTYVMPFAVAGLSPQARNTGLGSPFSGEMTRGLVAPGELSVGLGPGDKMGAWAFTYAPDAVIGMVARLHDALEPSRKSLADHVVMDAVQTAIEMTKAQAFQRAVDLSVPPAAQRPGWPRRLATTFQLLTAHVEARLWRFEGGRPLGWRMEEGRWVHPDIGRLLAVAPDVMEAQVSEERILAGEDPLPRATVCLPTDALRGTAGRAEIDPQARVSPGARIGAGCRIGAGSVVADETILWNSIITGSTIGPGAVVERSVVEGSRLAGGSVVRSCRIESSELGAGSIAEAASVIRSRLSDKTTVSAFGQVEDVRARFATILGGRVRSADIGTHLMSMHMAGDCSHLVAVPTPVEVEGRTVLVPAIPMLGGGSIIRGAEGRPVRMECCFIGSNAFIEAGAYIGFGCFVLGRCGPDAGLPPFTISTGGGAEKHQIGAVLGSLASTIITHFLSWTYQAVGPQGAPAVAKLVPQAICRGIDAVSWELARRELSDRDGSRSGPLQGGGQDQAAGDFACYASLPRYSDDQLRSGLRNYRRAFDSGAWEMTFGGGQLRFAGRGGHWTERQGGAQWRAE